MTSPAGRVSIPPFSNADTPDKREMMRWALERLPPLVLDWGEEEEEGRGPWT